MDGFNLPFVPASRDTLFMRGFSDKRTVDEVRDYFVKKDGAKTVVSFSKHDFEKGMLFLALKFDSREVAQDIFDKYDKNEVLGNRIVISWFKDLKKAREAYTNNRGRPQRSWSPKRTWQNRNVGNSGRYSPPRRWQHRSRSPTRRKRRSLSRSPSRSRSHSKSHSPSYSRSRSREKSNTPEQKTPQKDIIKRSKKSRSTSLGKEGKEEPEGKIKKEKKKKSKKDRDRTTSGGDKRSRRSPSKEEGDVITTGGNHSKERSPPEHIARSLSREPERSPTPKDGRNGAVSDRDLDMEGSPPRHAKPPSPMDADSPTTAPPAADRPAFNEPEHEGGEDYPISKPEYTEPSRKFGKGQRNSKERRAESREKGRNVEHVEQSTTAYDHHNDERNHDDKYYDEQEYFGDRGGADYGHSPERGAEKGPPAPSSKGRSVDERYPANYYDERSSSRSRYSPPVEHRRAPPGGDWEQDYDRKSQDYDRKPQDYDRKPAPISDHPESPPYARDQEMDYRMEESNPPPPTIRGRGRRGRGRGNRGGRPSNHGNMPPQRGGGGYEDIDSREPGVEPRRKRAYEDEDHGDYGPPPPGQYGQDYDDRRPPPPRRDYDDPPVGGEDPKKKYPDYEDEQQYRDRDQRRDPFDDRSRPPPPPPARAPPRGRYGERSPVYEDPEIIAPHARRPGSINGTGPRDVERNVLGLPTDKMTLVKQKKEDLEKTYRQDCDSFTSVVRMLISKDPSVEENMQHTLKENLKDVGQRCIMELKEYIEELKTSDDDMHR